jgi:hypothetical protein
VFASYAPSVAAAGGSAFLLASDLCLRVSLRPWGERIDALIAAGDWLPALALAQVREAGSLPPKYYPMRTVGSVWGTTTTSPDASRL